MKNKQNKIRPSAVNRSLKIVAGALTTFWILLLCFPIYWMIITSLSGSYSEYSNDVKFWIDVPKCYTMTVEYTREEAEALGEEGLYLEANSLLWRMYNYKVAGVGKAEIITCVEGQETSIYSLSSSDYEINKEKMWSKNILKHDDIVRVLSKIQENEWVNVKENVKISQQQNKNEYTSEMMTDFLEDENITGKVTDCSYHASYESLLNNYKIAWAYPSKIGLESGLLQPIVNTIFVAVMTIVFNVFVCSLAAYSLSKLLPHFLKNKLQLFIMASGMVPGTLTLIPKFQVIQNMGLADSLWAIIMPSCASFGAMLLFKGAFDSYPNDILEAARIDGASELYVFLRMALPSARGVVGVQILSIFVASWNNYFWPSMIIREESKYTVALVLNYMMNIGSNTYPTLLALGFIISIPTLLVYALFQKFLTYGIDYSGVKG